MSIQEKIEKLLEREDNAIGKGLTYKEEAKEIIKTCRQEMIGEVVEIVKKHQKQYHGGGNGRRLFIQLVGELKKH